MSAEVKKELHLEIAHVLFMDVVGFSKLLINDQSEILEQLNQLVRETDSAFYRRRNGAGFCDNAGRPRFLRDGD